MDFDPMEVPPSHPREDAAEGNKDSGASARHVMSAEASLPADLKELLSDSGDKGHKESLLDFDPLGGKSSEFPSSKEDLDLAAGVPQHKGDPLDLLKQSDQDSEKLKLGEADPHAVGGSRDNASSLLPNERQSPMGTSAAGDHMPSRSSEFDSFGHGYPDAGGFESPKDSAFDPFDKNVSPARDQAADFGLFEQETPKAGRDAAEPLIPTLSDTPPVPSAPEPAGAGMAGQAGPPPAAEAGAAFRDEPTPPSLTPEPAPPLIPETHVSEPTPPPLVPEPAFPTSDSPVPTSDSPVPPSDSPVPPSDSPVPPSDSPIPASDSPIPPEELPYINRAVPEGAGRPPIPSPSSVEAEPPTPVERLAELREPDAPLPLEALRTRAVQEALASVVPPAPDKPLPPTPGRRAARAASAVMEILLWRDPKKSGAALAVGLVLLLSMVYCSFISVVAYFALALLTVTLGFRLYKTIMATVQKTNEGHPFQDLLSVDTTVTEEKGREMADKAVAHLNCCSTHLRDLFLVKDIFESVKFGFALYLLTYLGAWFNTMTLIIMGYVAAFTLPKVYEQNQEKIDQVLAQVKEKLCEISSKVKAALPIGKKTAEPAVAEEKKEE